jgi:uncharacterized membrane protein YsdA (DUF1294 family)/cold shock CspA family protein
MRLQGKITTWHDDKGYGFVTQNGDGPRAFVHISAFESRGRRPALGDIVSYQAAADEKGRLRAERVSIVAAPRRAPPPSGEASVRSLVLACAVVVLFSAVLVGCVVMGRIPYVLPIIYLAMSIVTLFVYGFDKSAAMNDRRRTPEDTLNFLALVCGWPGALLAQFAFRHKARKRPFQVMFWGVVAVNCGVLIWLTTDAGNRVWRALL